MRILHIGKYYPPVTGGMERFLADLVGAQRAQGHEVEVLVHQHARSTGAADPPWLMKMSGIPVSGSTPSIAPIL